jgi:phosphopantetheinyl transferase
MTNAVDKRKRQFCASRLLLNRLRSQYLPGHNMCSEETSTFPSRLIGTDNNVHSFNISHSNNWVAVAIADKNIGTDIGIDIQTLKQNWTPEKAAFFCSEAQIKQGYGLSQPENYFTQLWCQKEAYFKATQKKFVEIDFMNDASLSSQVFDDKGMPVFLSLYCASNHKAQFQLLKL